MGSRLFARSATRIEELARTVTTERQTTAKRVKEERRRRFIRGV
jgi:hypothetical protein